MGPASSSEDKIAALICRRHERCAAEFLARHTRRARRPHRLHPPHLAPPGQAGIRSCRICRDRKSAPAVLAGGEAVMLNDQAEVTITTRELEGTAERSVDHLSGLPATCKPGDRMLLDDGKLELAVESMDTTDVHTRVVHGGLLKEHKGINLPGVMVNIPSLTEKDLDDLAFGVAQGVDYIAISFVRRAEGRCRRQAHAGGGRPRRRQAAHHRQAGEAGRARQSGGHSAGGRWGHGGARRPGRGALAAGSADGSKTDHRRAPTASAKSSSPPRRCSNR